MLCISVFMSFGLCMFRGTTTMTPVSPELPFPGSLDIDVVFPTPAVTSTVINCDHMYACVCVCVFQSKYFLSSSFSGLKKKSGYLFQFISVTDSVKAETCYKYCSTSSSDSQTTVWTVTHTQTEMCMYAALKHDQY